MSRAALATRTLAAHVEAILRQAGAVPGQEGYPGVAGFRIDAPEPDVFAEPPAHATARVRHLGPADADWTATVNGYCAALKTTGLRAWVMPAWVTLEGVPYVVVQRRIVYPGSEVAA